MSGVSEAVFAERVAQLTKFYESHNPEKVGDAETLVRGYPFLSIVASLEAKYGKSVLEAELPTWIAELGKQEQDRVKKLTDRLEHTSVEEFHKLKEQLAEFQNQLAGGGIEAVRKSLAETTALNLTDEQITSTIENLQELVSLSNKVEVGSKSQQLPETVTVHSSVKVPAGHETGSQFTATLPNNQTVLITVPANVSPGDTIPIKVEVAKDQESIFQAAAHSSAVKAGADADDDEGFEDADDGL